MKKLFTLLLAAMLLLALAACGPASGFEYRYDEELGGMVITKYKGDSNKVRIPEKIKGKPVVAIGGYYFPNGYIGAFQQKNVKEVHIPDSVTSIGSNAFRSCKELTDINIPDGVTSIGHWAFTGTAWLNAQPDGLVYAGKVAYTYKGEMPEGTSVVLLEGTTIIADDAFSGCAGLTSITIPDSVTSIGRRAFSGCEELTSITIPGSVKNIGRQAFMACSLLESVTIGDGVTSIGNWAFGLTPWLYAQPDGLVYAGKIAYTYKGEMPEGTSITLKEGTTGIADMAFDGYEGLTGITIPDSLTSIGYGAFYGCTGLKSIAIPNGVEGINNYTFNGCTGLKSITIPDSVTRIGSEAFYGCTGLTSITIPDSVTIIGSLAFMSCSSQLQATYKGVTYKTEGNTWGAYDVPQYDLPQAFYDAVNGK
ncbi:MAG: leucine-rich repeat domain-containing protein [Clostridiales bacterium]|nr:leucine-rich repeat domain-containing protein [Clostridiales bacterium]